MKNSNVVEATFEKLIFRNEKTSFSIFSVRTYDVIDLPRKKGCLTCRGIIPPYVKDIPLTLTGKWDDADQIFCVSEVKEGINNASMTLSYLEKINGIGRKLAENIVKNVGANVFELSKRPDFEELLVKKVPKLGAVRAKALAEKLGGKSSEKEVFDIFMSIGAPYSCVLKLCTDAHGNPLDELKRNPYKVGKSVGLSFHMCDYIASNYGFDACSKKRLYAVIDEAFEQMQSAGNVFSNAGQIIYFAKKINRNSAFIEEIPDEIFKDALASHPYIIRERSKGRIKYFTLEAYKNEASIVRNISRLTSSAKDMPLTNKIINEVKNASEIPYEDEQIETFNALKKTGIKIITGGPGTGKTSTILAILKAYQMMFPDAEIQLCAPTGRAAQRMSDMTGFKAQTIHRLLEYKPFAGNDASFKNHNDPLTADFVILDEFSMVNEEIMAMLLDALKNGSILVCLGDSDQLAAVGAGNVLFDCLASDKLEHYKLSRVHRQNEDSVIIKNALRINNGNINLKEGNDFEIIKDKTESEILYSLEKIVAEHYSERDPFALQILCPSYKGTYGIHALNRRIQGLVNPDSIGITYGKTEFRINDKIIMTANNYDIGYLNGDIGFIKDINNGSILVEINENEFVVGRGSYDDIKLAYAISIHKSQGSEFKNVVIFMPDTPKIMLQRNLLYTGVTRAKNKIWLYDVGGMEYSIKNCVVEKRQTCLKERMLGEPADIIKKGRNIWNSQVTC